MRDRLRQIARRLDNSIYWHRKHVKLFENYRYVRYSAPQDSAGSAERGGSKKLSSSVLSHQLKLRLTSDNFIKVMFEYLLH